MNELESVQTECKVCKKITQDKRIKFFGIDLCVYFLLQIVIPSVFNVNQLIKTQDYYITICDAITRCNQLLSLPVNQILKSIGKLWEN